MHDFKNFPELANSQLEIYYWESPHKQILEDFTAHCIRVHDGDTITLRWNERDFDFPIRLNNISCRELKEVPSRDTGFQMSATGKEAQQWLEERVLDKEIMVKITKSNRVDKWGRLLGQVICEGEDMGEAMVRMGLGVPWKLRNDGRTDMLTNQLKGAEIKSL